MNTTYIIEKIQEIETIKSRTMADKCFKFYEEYGELCGAYLSYKKSCGSEYKNKTREDLIEETVDTLLCILSINQTFIGYEILGNQDKNHHTEISILLTWIPALLYKPKSFIAKINNIFYILNVSHIELEQMVDKKLNKWREKVSL